MLIERLRGLSLAILGCLFLIADGSALHADTATAMGDRGGEGSTPFTGLANTPEANLFTGTANTAVPIILPPGRSNLTPALALQYSSAGGPSPYGYGWDLPLGRIERSTKHGVPRCTGPTSNEFILSLPSGTVELVNDPPNSSTYRPRVEEAYLQAVKSVSSNSWEVRDRSGTRYVFGSVASARSPSNTPFMQLQSGLCVYTAAWALTRIESPNGNAVDVTYNSVDNVSYPEFAYYGGQTTADHLYRVRFHYEPRPLPDQPVRYLAGVRTVLALRLKQIFVAVRQPTLNEFRAYTLGYAAGSPSHLSTVSLTGYPTQIFSYTSSVPFLGVGEAYTPPANVERLRLRNKSAEVQQSILDMNGDGFVDLVRRVGSGVPWRVYPGGPNGFALSYVDWSIPAAIGSSNEIRNVWVTTVPCHQDGWACTARDTFDIDGDGIPDYVIASDTGLLAECGGQRRWKVYPGRAFTTGGEGGGFRATCANDGVTPCSSDASCPGAGNFCGKRWCSPEAFVRKHKHTETLQDVVDMNADGLPDLVVAQSTSWSVHLNTGSGFEATPITFSAPVASLQETINDDDVTIHMLVDFNGDALPDLVRQPKPSGAPLPYDSACGGSPSNPVRCLRVHLNTGQGFADPFLVPVPGWDGPGNVQLGVQRFVGPQNNRQTVRDLFDVDGDGLPDWVRVDPATQEWRVILNTGSTLEALSGGVEPHIWGPITGPLRVQDGNHTNVDIFDFNGDGFLDRVAWVNNAQWHVHQNLNLYKPNLLTHMFNGFLGTTHLRYAPSSTCVALPYGNLVPCDHTGGDGRPDLPFVTWVVTAIRETDGLCTPPGGVDVFSSANPCIGSGNERVAYFSYRDGRFDAAAREFRGFRFVYRNSTDLNTTLTTFGQDTLSKGRVLAVNQYAGLFIAGLPPPPTVHQEANTWNAPPIGGGRNQLYLQQRLDLTWDGAGAGVFPLIAVHRQDPPDAFGNILNRSTRGFFNDHVVETFTEYASSQGTSQVYDKPRRTYSQKDGTLFTELWFYYDGYSANADYGKVGAGNVTRVVSRLGSNPANYPETRMTYDAYGNVLTVTDAEGRITQTVYDAYALYPASQFNALGHETKIVTDYRWGKPSKVTDSNGAETTYGYDTAGRLQCVKRPLSAMPCSTAYTYTYASAPGQLSSVAVDQEEPANVAGGGTVRTTERFDAMGRHRETRTFRVVNGAGETVVADKVEYDQGGRLAKRYEAHLASAGPSEARATIFDYHLNGGSAVDPLGRLYEIRPPNGTSRRHFYRGNEQSLVDEEGVETRRLLDPHGNVLREEVWTGGPTAYSLAEYTYDGAGRVLTRKQNGNAATTITHTYDLLGRKTQTVDPDSGTWKYFYDKVGNLIVQEDPKADQHLQYCYDALNRVTLDCPFNSDYTGLTLATQGYCSLPCDNEEVRYTYDQASVANAKGRLTKVTDFSGSTEFQAYDKRGRLLKVKKTIAAGGNTSATTEYQYDTADRVRRVRYPDGEWVETVYDESGQPIMLQSNTAYVSSVSYDLFGRATTVNRANGVDDLRSYHQSPGALWHQRLANVRTRKGGTDYLNLSYQGYTARGAIQQVVDNRNPSGSLSNKGIFVYDPLGRLTDVTTNAEINGAYRYDALGNMTRKESRYFDYGAAKPHQPSNIRIGSETAPPTPVPHDANGNRLDATGGSHDYTYDAWNRLREIRVPGGPTVNFIYDYSGRRVVKKVGGVVATRYYGDLTETSAGQQYKSYFLGGVRVASQRTGFVGWELAAASNPAVQFAANELGRPAIVLVLRPDVQLAAALCVALLGGGLWLAPWRRRRTVGIPLRQGQVIAIALAFSWATLPLPILIRPAAAQCGAPAPTPTPPPSGEVRHYHTDHLGSTQAITNAAGNLIEQIRYRAYGEVRGRWNGAGTPISSPSPEYRYEFTTYETEMASGLHYAGARLYDPALGMFLTHDPARQFASPYTYTNWDPMNATDPNGEFSLVVGIILFAVLGAIAAGIDAGIRSGDAGTAFKAIGISLAGSSVAPGTSYGLSLVAPDLFGKPDPRNYAISLIPIVGTARGAAENFKQGNYASGTVGAVGTIVSIIGLAFTAYNLYQTYQTGLNASSISNGQLDLRYGIADPQAIPTPGEITGDRVLGGIAEALMTIEKGGEAAATQALASAGQYATFTINPNRASFGHTNAIGFRYAPLRLIQQFLGVRPVIEIGRLTVNTLPGGLSSFTEVILHELGHYYYALPDGGLLASMGVPTANHFATEQLHRITRRITGP
jgi:RHS repeat-associated protein